MADPSSPAVSPPRQARSQRTLQRVLDATEQLLEERPFEAISVQEIVRRAGTSVGAFYTRFRDKEALLPALYARYDAWLTTELASRQVDPVSQGQALPALVASVARQIIDLLAHRRYLQRAVALHARQRPEGIDATTRQRRSAQMEFIRDALLTRRDEITHPDPERAVDLAVFFAAAVCREAILFGQAPHAAMVQLERDELAQEIERLMLGYLTATAVGGATRSRSKQ